MDKVTPSHEKLLQVGGIAGMAAIQGNIEAATSLAKELQSTFGPHGRDKLFFNQQTNDITVTNGTRKVFKY